LARRGLRTRPRKRHASAQHSKITRFFGAGVTSVEGLLSFRPLVKKKKAKLGDELLEDNRKARFDFEILEELEAGLVLHGSEVKSIRDRRVSLKEAYCQFREDQLYLLQAHIAEFTQAHARNHPPLRARKLLLHRRELDRLHEAVKQQGLTIIPLALYLKNRHIKLLIGLARGKKIHDKRASIKEREQKREMQRAVREHQ
jgi:SsrA-binding protein